MVLHLISSRDKKHCVIRLSQCSGVVSQSLQSDVRLRVKCSIAITTRPCFGPQPNHTKVESISVKLYIQNRYSKLTLLLNHL